MPMAGSSKRSILLLVGVSAFIAILFLSTFRSQSLSVRDRPYTNNEKATTIPPTHNLANIDQATLSGGTIMPKLGNETAKAELGRAAWKLFHTIMARYPDTPSPDERTALQSYIHLFVRLYPCGECAEHFRQIVAKFPPQVSSRSAAAAWACHVHNEVNKSLGKEVFDCADIGDFYDCGCAEDEKEAMGGEAVRMQQEEVRSVELDGVVGASGRDLNLDLLTGDRPFMLEKEG